jgi:hypothetical protein
VKQILHIFFLGLSILFSFGFTSFQSGCTAKVGIIETNHSCCKVESERSLSHEHLEGDCCGTDNCQGSCCFESVDYFQFNDFIVQGSTIDLNNLDISLIPSIHVFLLDLANSNKNLLLEGLSIPPDLLLHKSITKHIIIKNQSWLI